MKTGIIICSRTDSNRVPNKPFRLINGVAVIEHLIKRLQKTGLPIYIAVPNEQKFFYKHLGKLEGVVVHSSKFGSDPLARTVECAQKYKLDAVIRITHDKILIQESDIAKALECFNSKSLDYLYSSKFIPGSGFEIFSTVSLGEASRKYKDIEFLGYAVRTVTKNSFNFDCRHPRGDYRFLIDFPEDLKLFEVLFSQLGNSATLLDCIKYLNVNPEVKQINKLPTLTIYTCVYNGAEYIERCMETIARQRGFSKCEYIIIDDCSTDKTTELVAKFCIKHKNAHWIRNEKNLGLASSSNVALKNARGKYIMRLDADDYFVSISAMHDMIDAIETSRKEAIYPANYFGSHNKIQQGKEFHHIGGSIFLKRAIDHIKFTEGLKGYEGYDFWLRAKDQLEIGYISKPMFFYSQRPNSMSKTDPVKRAKIKRDLEKYQGPTQ